MPILQFIGNVFEFNDCGAQKIGYIVRNETIRVPDGVKRTTLKNRSFREAFHCEGCSHLDASFWIREPGVSRQLGQDVVYLRRMSIEDVGRVHPLTIFDVNFLSTGKSSC
jgi:hypothetical protein